MKYFTKFLCLFLGAAMMLTMAACGSKSGTDANAGADGEKKQLVVATSPDFPPFEFLDGSQIVGIEPALMQAIADKLGMELVWEQVDFDSIIPGSRLTARCVVFPVKYSTIRAISLVR